LAADSSVLQYSNANHMHVTQDLNSFGEFIAHAQCSIDEKTIMDAEVMHAHIPDNEY
jgi:uncharacterized glyoxalase superfamily protein PhnB